MQKVNKSQSKLQKFIKIQKLQKSGKGIARNKLIQICDFHFTSTMFERRLLALGYHNTTNFNPNGNSKISIS